MKHFFKKVNISKKSYLRVILKVFYLLKVVLRIKIRKKFCV